ncbi:phage tail protein [Micromonospora sp. NPDC006766]|uniref:phage tail protein n=1 Tax=Micromonospora sp. NPDC006766 TaxID=3154778 RepID=UPI0033C29D8F
MSSPGPDPVVAAVAAELLREAEATIESLPAMLTAATAPDDVAAWLRYVGGVERGDRLDADRGRRVLAALARERHPRGTAAALRALLEDHYGCPAEVLDPGGTTWSAGSGPAPVPAGPPTLVVRLRIADPPPEADVEAVIRSAIPAHLPLRIEFAAGQLDAAASPTISPWGRRPA